MSTNDGAEAAAIERRIREKAIRRVHARVGLMWHAGVFLFTAKDPGLITVKRRETSRIWDVSRRGNVILAAQAGWQASRWTTWAPQGA